MSASSSDSWILIALTILVVLLLFYLSKKMICNSYGNSNSEDSPTRSPTSSTTSTSTSFSDYFYDGYDGRSPLDLIGTVAATASSNGTSSESDALAIDIADSFNSSDHHHHHYDHQNRVYRINNGCSSINYNIGNNNHNINDLLRNDSVASNGERMSFGDGGRAISAICSSNTDTNNRRIDFSGSPPTLSTSVASTTTGSQQQQPILSPISIIAGPALDRKTMLETQIRNQIAKIVQAEREIQRLALLLSLEQRQGFDAENNNILTATRASLLQNQHRHPSWRQYIRGLIPPAGTSEYITTMTPNSQQSPPEVTAESTTDATATSRNNSTKNSNATSLSQENVSDDLVRTSAVADNHSDNDHHQNNGSTETPSAENQQHCFCPRHSLHHQNANAVQSSDFHTANSFQLNESNSIQNPLPQRQQQMLSCGLDTNYIANFHRQRYCGCNSCFIGTRTRRMLMLRRMLLPVSSFPIATNASIITGVTEEGFLSRSVGPSACDLHYPQEEQQQQPYQPVPDPQSGFSDYPHQRENDQHQVDDDPPPYEECVRSEWNSAPSYYDQNRNQNLYYNRHSSADTSSGSSRLENQTEPMDKRTTVCQFLSRV